MLMQQSFETCQELEQRKQGNLNEPDKILSGTHCLCLS